MFFTDSRYEAASSIADGFFYSSLVIAGAIVLAKLIEVLGVRSIFHRRK